VADGDDEVRTGEDVHLAELDRLRRVDVPRGAQDTEKGVAVALQLGALMGVHRVLDGKLVQRELVSDLGELLVGRAIEPDPGHPAAAPAGLGHLSQAVGFGDPLAVAIDGAPDDHVREPTGARSGRSPPAR